MAPIESYRKEKGTRWHCGAWLQRRLLGTLFLLMILQREHDVNCKVIYIALLIFASGSPPPRGPIHQAPRLFVVIPPWIRAPWSHGCELVHHSRLQMTVTVKWGDVLWLGFGEHQPCFKTSVEGACFFMSMHCRASTYKTEYITYWYVDIWCTCDALTKSECSDMP